MKIALYLRVSGLDQVEGDGFERQVHSCMGFLRRNNLLPIDPELVFKEEGVSGTVEGMDRPAFAELLGRAEAEQIDTIVVERMDRLARNLMVSEVLLGECRKRGIKVFAADQGTTTDMASDGGDPTKDLIRQIMGALAQWERACIILKLGAARARLRAKNGKCEGCKPYGTRPGEKQILEILGNFAETLTLQGLADVLNEGGMKTRKNTKWTTAAVYSLLKAKNIKKGK